MTIPEATRQPALPEPPSPRWSLAPKPDPAKVSSLQQELNLPETLSALLVVRGARTPDAARGFLRPLLSQLHPPGALVDANRAADRIEVAIHAQETILVHGDYDVDGIAATAALTRWLRRLGARRVVPFVPQRIRDGYDFGPAGLEAAVRAAATLVITVDSGIQALEPVERAQRLGIDVIVTDHHTPGEALPAAFAVVNPLREDSPYPHPNLCGTGVAFKLCQLLGARFGIPEEEVLPLLDLVALATVADLVPLEDENRVLVRYGLRALRRTSNRGLQALLESTGLLGKEVEAGQVGFVLAPRINAAGRVGDSERALRLLVTDDSAEALAIAWELENVNRLRQEEDRRTLEEALQMLAADYRPERDFGIVLAAEGWHPGVIGIVASRVVDRVHRPTVLVSLDGAVGRGSARSIPGFHLLEAVKACRDRLVRFGGHTYAAGMDLERGELEAFRSAFNEEARRRLRGVQPEPMLTADLEVSLADLTPEVARYLRYLGPFGIGNRRPLFLARGVGLTGPPRVVGRGHLKVAMRQDGVWIDAIGFGLAERLPPERLDFQHADVLFHLGENTYRGVTTVQARLADLRPADSDTSAAVRCS